MLQTAQVSFVTRCRPGRCDLPVATLRRCAPDVGMSVFTPKMLCFFLTDLGNIMERLADLWSERLGHAAYAERWHRRLMYI